MTPEQLAEVKDEIERGGAELQYALLISKNKRHAIGYGFEDAEIIGKLQQSILDIHLVSLGILENTSEEPNEVKAMFEGWEPMEIQ